MTKNKTTLIKEILKRTKKTNNSEAFDKVNDMSEERLEKYLKIIKQL